MKDENRDITLEALVQAVPYVGGPLATLYFGRKQEMRFQRLERFYEELREEIGRLKNLPNISSHNPNELSAILEELHEKVEAEHLDIKRRLYKKYFKKTMMFPVNGNFDERKLYLDILGGLTPLQIELLVYFSQQSGTVKGSSIIKPGVDQAVIAGSIAQLKTLGLAESSLDSIVIGGSRGAIHENIALSNFGRKFHDFCLG
jgi:hypothetical protein